MVRFSSFATALILLAQPVLAQECDLECEMSKWAEEVGEDFGYEIEKPCDRLCDFSFWLNAYGGDIKTAIEEEAINGLIDGEDIPLVEASSAGNIEGVRLLLAAGADVTKTNHLGNTPLHRAKNGEIARMLLDAGAKVDALNNIYAPPSVHATEYNHPDVLTLLVEAGADVNYYNPATGISLVGIASYQGHTEILEDLIGWDADVTFASHGQYSPLMFAVRLDHKDYEIVEKTIDLLLDAGANPRETREIRLQGDSGKRSVMELAGANPVLKGSSVLTRIESAIAKAAEADKANVITFKSGTGSESSHEETEELDVATIPPGDTDAKREERLANSYKILLKNTCSRPIEVAVVFRDAATDTWSNKLQETELIRLRRGKSAYATLDGEDARATGGSIWFYYAVEGTKRELIGTLPLKIASLGETRKFAEGSTAPRKVKGVLTDVTELSCD